MSQNEKAVVSGYDNGLIILWDVGKRKPYMILKNVF